jgi:Phytoene/squalene synthetase
MVRSTRVETDLTGSDMTERGGADAGVGGAAAYQDQILPQVSRTFALTIPQLPDELAQVVGNAYLLCRIADTIEDEPALPLEDKRRYEQALSDAVARGAGDLGWVAELVGRLSDATLPAEAQLVQNLPLVLEVTRGFSVGARKAIARCVAIMGFGMHRFQRQAGPQGLPDLVDLDRYCYYVAGVVGEMLTDLFCEHDAGIAGRAELLHARAVSFGQGLQMTNILKDQFEDRARGVCWLPAALFARHGVDADALATGRWSDGYRAAMDELVGVAHAHLRNALDYSLAIPPQQDGLRRFLLWAVALALLTLRNIHRTPGYRSGAEVKVTRRTLASTIMVTNLTIRSDAALRRLFAWFARGLPLTPLEADWHQGIPQHALDERDGHPAI